jgi:hypothetical protein
MSPTMTKTQSCGGGTAACGTERTRFFPGQLITPDDLTQDQQYFRERSRRHNRLLHGWGIVCGAGVVKGKNPCEVTVAEGFILGPHGDEIRIGKELTIDLCKESADGHVLDECGPPADPWCSDVRVDRRANSTLYLAVRYAECNTRPMRSSGCGCGCSSGDCEYSRIRDSYVIGALTELPASYKSMTPPAANAGLVCPGTMPACPPCPAEPWVILADVRIGADGRTVASLDLSAHRRYVASFANFFYTCKP